MVEPGGKGYCPCEYIPRVREAACLKDSLPADPLQPTFALEISCRCNGLLLAALPGTPWSLSVRAVDRRFSMPSDRDSSGPGLCPSVCCQVSEGRWKDLFLTSRFLAARHRPHNPKAVLPLCRAWIHPAPALAGAARTVDIMFCPIPPLSRAKLLFWNSLFMRKYFEVCRLFTSVLFFLPIFSFQRVGVSSPTFNTWAHGHL